MMRKRGLTTPIALKKFFCSPTLLIILFACLNMGQSWSQTTFTWDEGPTEDRINPISTVISTIDGKSLRLTVKSTSVSIIPVFLQLLRPVL